MFLIQWRFTLAFTIVLHYVVTEEDEIDWMCGGTLVTDRHVVTAAHCVQKSEYGYVLTKIRVGEHDTRTDPDCELKVCAPAVQDRAIKNITSHPSFNKPAFHNDVAIIELDKPVTLNDDKILTSEEISRHSAWAKLDAVDCGDSAADRIIGGINAGLGQFPWIARLGYIEEDEIDWMCGGTLVTDRHVVTAAHCVQKSEYGYVLTKIRVGEHDTRTDPDCELKVCAPAVQDRAIKNITSHPSFNKPAFHNDVAIIELDKPVTLNDYVMPICLPRTTEQLANLRIGDQMTVAGWGKMNMTTEERANVLQVVGIPIVAPALCESFGKGFKLADSEICAGAEHNKDACGGDSGGPLMKVFDTPEGPKNYLVGVVSFGPTICGIKKPGVYASVAHFLKWILDNLV